MSDDTSEQGGKKVAAPHRNPMSRDEDSTRTRNVISPSQFPLNDPLTKKRFEVLEKEIKAQNDMIHQTEEELSFKMTYIQSLLESVCKDIINIGNQNTEFDIGEYQVVLEGDSMLEEIFEPRASEVSPIEKNGGTIGLESPIL